MSTDLDLADRIAMYVGGGLLLLAIPVAGLVTTLAGSTTPLYVYETADGSGQVLAPALAPDGAEVVSAPLVDPNLRATLVLAGLLVWGAYGAYRLATAAAGESAPSPSPTSAD
jgi:multisubunit Na+/H+ antiporter MnhB subunit